MVLIGLKLKNDIFIHMNKKIIYEVYRQHKLMGINKQILKENKIIRIGSEFIRDFFNTSQKAIKNSTDEVLIGSVKVTKKFVEDIMEILD